MAEGGFEYNPEGLELQQRHEVYLSRDEYSWLDAEGWDVPYAWVRPRYLFGTVYFDCEIRMIDRKCDFGIKNGKRFMQSGNMEIIPDRLWSLLELIYQREFEDFFAPSRSVGRSASKWLRKEKYW